MSINLDQRLETWDAHPQLQSPLFANIPAEVRLEIFGYAVMPTVYTFFNEPFEHDFRVAHNHDGDPDDDIRDELERWRQNCSSLEADRRALECWDGDEYKSWRGHPDHNPHPYRRSRQSWTVERPGHIGRPVLSPTVLLACRRAFSEARPIMFSQTERCFWMPESHPHPCQLDYEGVSVPLEWSRERRRWERKFTTIHLLVHLRFIYWAMFPERHLLSRVEHLRLTLRDCDWRIFDERWRIEDQKIERLRRGIFYHTRRAIGWEGNHLPLVDPFTTKDRFIYYEDEILELLSGNGSLGGEEISIRGADENQGQRPSWVPPSVSFLRGTWAREFINMPRLKTFTITFDACETDRSIVSAIVDWAIRAWRFPINPKHTGHDYLSAAGNPVRKTSWRGTRANLRDMCKECGKDVMLGGRLAGGPQFGQCGEHWKCAEKFFMKLGLRMYSWTVTWTPRKHEPQGDEYFTRGLTPEFIESADYDLKSESDSSDGDEVLESEGEPRRMQRAI